jgi:hypothetical protein
MTINVNDLILEFKKATPNAQVTALHRLVHVLNDSVVLALLERCLWKLHSTGKVPSMFHKQVMDTINEYKSNSLKL